MPGAKAHFPEFQAHVGAKITPDELDLYQQYVIMKPSVSTSFLGTVDPGTVDDDFVIDNAYLDYPRNLKLVSLGAGAHGGTATVSGKNYFGETVSEVLSIGSATGGGTIQGSVVFAKITSASWSFGGTGNGTPTLGYASTAGTGALGAMFGLPFKIGGTADLKRVTWVDNATSKTYGTPAAQVLVSQHAFKPTDDIAAADDYILDIVSTYSALGDRVSRVTNL